MTARPIQIAEYILSECKKRWPEQAVSTMKLQKLLYYAQAWSLVWDSTELFEEDFQAWANGPVLPELYQMHRGRYKVDDQWAAAHREASGFPPFIPSTEQGETLDSVIEFYGPRSAQWLSDLTHKEQPWIEARRDCGPLERSNEVITKDSMYEYYDSLA
ncbi:MAG: hypothetical protein CMN76_08670 [Spirochaetaceae bacterium]|nr:hypothetical protein [Spirochaetaceae bacterium]